MHSIYMIITLIMFMFAFIVILLGSGHRIKENIIIYRDREKEEKPEENIFINIQKPHNDFYYEPRASLLDFYSGVDFSSERNFDFHAVYDKLTPPRQRGLYDQYNPFRRLYDYDGRFPSKFIKIGTLVDETVENGNKYKFLHLMGSRTNYDRFSYYATPTYDNDTQKFQIDGTKELYSNDEVIVHLLDKTYKVKIDKDAYSLFYND